MGGLGLYFVIMAISLVWSTNQLQAMNARILTDANEIDMAHLLETVILAERREDLLWRFTSSEVHSRQKTVYLNRATDMAAQLAKAGMSGKDAKAIDRIEGLFVRFRALTTSEPPVPIEEISSIGDQLLRAVEGFRASKREQMSKTLASSTRLNQIVDTGAIALFLFVFLIAVSGAYLLLKRIILPTFALNQAAKEFGRGEFGARARILRNDEFGSLCQTFNTMAENIQILQEERLNFIAALAHDLKNPLVLVGGTARSLRKKLTLPAEQMKLVQRLVEQSARMEELLSDLMDSVQLQTGNLTLNMVELDLGALLSGIQRLQSEMITTHRIMLEGECKCKIKADARRLERAVANLISNAVKYSPRNSLVRIRLEQRGADALISVIDEGAGIPAVDIPSLFQPFRRLPQTLDMAKGTGLGLFSVKKIIDSHGGRIDIESEPGKGTAVTITLPIVPCE